MIPAISMYLPWYLQEKLKKYGSWSTCFSIKPTDLDLNCFQKHDISGFSNVTVRFKNLVYNIKHVFFSNKMKVF